MRLIGETEYHCIFGCISQTNADDRYADGEKAIYHGIALYGIYRAECYTEAEAIAYYLNRLQTAVVTDYC